MSWKKEIGHYQRDIELVCESKVEEFVLLGYDRVFGEDIWAYVCEKKYGDGTYPPLHQIVNDILSVKVTDFMNWLTIRAFKGNAPFDMPKDGSV